jgi:hypothetical protein
MGREWRTDYERAHEALHTGKLAETDRSSLRSLNHSFTLDFIIGCELEADARRVMAVLPKRFARFRLTIHPEKTALIAFKQPPSREPSARGTGSFDFLGFTHYGAKTRRGYWVIKRKTVGKRLRRCMRAIWTWCRDNRHAPLQEQYQALCLKLRGYYQYYGLRGNCKMLEVVLTGVFTRNLTASSGR